MQMLDDQCSNYLCKVQGAFGISGMRRHSCTFLVPTKFTPLPNTQICLTTTLSFTLISTSARALLLSLGNNIVHSGAHFLDSLLGVFGAKNGSTSDKDVGACA